MLPTPSWGWTSTGETIPVWWVLTLPWGLASNPSFLISRRYWGDGYLFNAYFSSVCNNYHFNFIEEDKDSMLVVHLPFCTSLKCSHNIFNLFRCKLHLLQLYGFDNVCIILMCFLKAFLQWHREIHFLHGNGYWMQFTHVFT